MRTIAASMTWEVVRRGRWNFLTTIFGFIAATAVMYFGFRQNGPVATNDKSMLQIGYIVLQVLAFAFGISMYDAQGKVARLYAYPISTSALVAFRLFPAMTLIALMMMFVTALLNVLFDFGWPITGPVLLAAVAFGLVESVIWLTEKSTGWLIIAVSSVGVGVGLWFKSRFGPVSVEPEHFWTNITQLELATMLGFTGAAYSLAVFAVARNRRGEAPISTGFCDWLDRVLSRSQPATRSFGGPLHALAWSEWRRKGWAMPVGALVLLGVGFVSWAFAFRSAESLFSGLAIGGFTIVLLGFVGGIILGNTGLNDGDFVMNSFLATRPISDAELARVCLATAVRSLLSAWAIWAAAVGIAYGCLTIYGATDRIRLPDDLGWGYFVLPLAFAWITVATTMCVGLTGRVLQILVIFGIGFVLVTLNAVTSRFLLSPDGHLLVQRIVAIVIQIGVVAGVVWVFMEARRRDLISMPKIYMAAILWLVGTGSVAVFLPKVTEPRITGVLMGAVAVALTILPLAAAPLAISLNRHR